MATLPIFNLYTDTSAGWYWAVLGLFFLIFKVSSLKKEFKKKWKIKNLLLQTRIKLLAEL